MTSIQKILIANRGEIARRIQRTCRALGIATVAVCSDADRDAPFVHEADEVVPLGGNRPAESYLRIDAILDAAKRTGADAIHPGYGFLSENADFAQACADAGLTFIGPSAGVIAAMGSKIEAKRLMAKAGVPLLPSIEVGTQAAEAMLKQVDKLTWPLLIKASAGGGGRGMRVVREPREFATLLEIARQEAQTAFGDGTLFIEPYIEASRHIEVQILGDTHGNVVHLFERECSIQRRHQKIIEEAPSPAVNDALRQEITGAAVRGAKQIGYVNAGTVEFLVAPDGKFYFLEVNTRLQVEHPVTECVTGLDLVKLQIQVAQGEPLPPEALTPQLQGHAIEVRLYAEDPTLDYLPAAGSLHRFRVPTVAGLRLESALNESAEISPYYDPMLAKIIVHAPTRTEAARRLEYALRRAEIHGLKTNRELLVRTLAHPEFLAGQIDTHFLERHRAAELAAPLGDAQVEGWHALAAALAQAAKRRAAAEVLPHVPSGWRNNPSQLQQTKFRVGEREILVEYAYERDSVQVRLDGVAQSDISVTLATGDLVRLAIGGVERACTIHSLQDTCYVDSPLGSTTLIEVARFPLPEEAALAGSLTAPLPGVVNEVKVQPGDRVTAGDVVLVIDSMKVFHAIAAPVSGRVAEVRVAAGNHVAGGAVLAVIEEIAE